jgi:hypothetical protein
MRYEENKKDVYRKTAEELVKLGEEYERFAVQLELLWYEALRAKMRIW